MSGLILRADDDSWGDPFAPAPDPDALEMIEAAARAGWRGISTLIDECGLRCIAATDGNIAIVTVRGLEMGEASRIAAGVRLLEDWSIPNLTALVRQVCDLADDGVHPVH